MDEKMDTNDNQRGEQSPRQHPAPTAYPPRHPGQAGPDAHDYMQQQSGSQPGQPQGPQAQLPGQQYPVPTSAGQYPGYPEPVYSEQYGCYFQYDPQTCTWQPYPPPFYGPYPAQMPSGAGYPHPPTSSGQAPDQGQMPQHHSQGDTGRPVSDDSQDQQVPPVPVSQQATGPYSQAYPTGKLNQPRPPLQTVPPYPAGQPYPFRQPYFPGQPYSTGQPHHTGQFYPTVPPPPYEESFLIVDPPQEKISIADQFKKENLLATGNVKTKTVDTITENPVKERLDDPVLEKGDDPVKEKCDDPVIEKGYDPVMEKGDDPVIEKGYDPGEEAECFIMEIHGLPPDISYDSVSLYFENKRKSGGGPVNRVELLDKGVALVYFEDSEALEGVLAKGNHVISNNHVEVMKHLPRTHNPAFVRETKDEQEQSELKEENEIKGDNSMPPSDKREGSEESVNNTIVVRGASDISKDSVSLYFENKRSGGGDVKEITDGTCGEILITFENSEDVQRVLERDKHMLSGRELEVCIFKPEELVSEAEDTGPPDTITVQNFGSLTDDTLLLYFENKRSGGGEVKEIQRDTEAGVVYITFEDPEVLQTVLQKVPHVLEKQTLEVCVHVPAKPEPVIEEPAGPPDTVAVRGCAGISDDMLEMYFENKRSGGGDLKEARRGSDDNVFLVTFDDPQVAAVVSNREHKIESARLEVCLVQPSAKQRQPIPGVSQSTNCTDQTFFASSDEEDTDDSVYVLEVKGFSENISSDTLGLYFENRRRSGGGEVERVEFTKPGTALVYFQEGNVVKKVLQRAPHLVDNKKVDVAPYRPSISQEDPLKGLKTGTVVEITGFDSQTSEDTFELYFDNTRRSGGEDVQEIRTVDTEEGSVKYIVFKSRKVAETVASRKHMIEGQKVKAKLYRAPTPPPPQAKYPDKVLIRRIKESTQRDALLNYLREKLDCDAKDLVYGDEPGTVLVTFRVGKEGIRTKLKQMKKISKKRPLEGAFLEISSVPISRCLLVTGLDSKTTESTLQYYFESKKSGNTLEEEVEKVVMVEDSNQALVYFTDHKVIELVLKRPHKLDGKNLKTSLYTECLGVGGGQQDPLWFRTPSPVTLADVDPYKLKFIRESKLNLKNLEMQMSGDFARIKWKSDNSVVLECTLTKTDTDARRKVKRWKAEAEESFNHFLNLLITEKVNVLQEVWKDVLDRIESIKLPQREAATIFVFEESNLIVIVGHKINAENLVKLIKETVAGVEGDHERKLKEIKETVTTLKKWQLNFLMAVGFPRDMMEKYDKLKIEIDVSKNIITFVGLMSDVKNAKIEMYERTTIARETVVPNFSDAQIQFIKKKDVRVYLVNKLKMKKLVGIWEEENGKLKVYSRSDSELTDVAHLLKQSVCQQDIELDEESVPLLSSSKWMSLCTEQTQARGDLIKIIPAIDKAKIVLVATDDLIASVAEEVNNFINDNTVYQDTVGFPKGKQRFLIQHMDADIKGLAQKFQGYSAEISFNKRSPAFTVKGTKDGLRIVIAELVKLANKIVHKSHLFNKPGIAKLIRSEKGDAHIMNIESLERCVIEKNHDEREQVTYGDKKRQKFMGTATGGPKILASTGLGDGRALYVSQGDITKMNVGAIVNAANQQLAHIGGLARAISEAGGHAIQAESDRIRLMNGDVDVGGVAVTGSGQLSCKYVIHAVGPIWSSGRNDDEGLLQEAIFNSLLEADKLQLKSIAIPALSTGIYKFPVAIATKAIVEAIQIHFQDNPTSSLKEVFVCDNNMSTVQEFSKAVELRFGRSNIEESLVYSRTEKMDYDQEEVDMETSFSGRYGRPEHRGRPFPVEQPGRRGGGSSRINVHYVISEIAKEQVDVIVNTTSDRLDLTNGAVSKSLLQAGGNRIQHECKRNYPNGIRHGEFAVTSGGNLKCQFVFHTCLSGWSQSDQEQELSDLVKACLQRASVEGCGSVAFPALGTGNLKYPADIVARTMYDAVEEFSTSNPGSSIQEVKFVLHHKDSVTIKAFSDYESGSSNGDTRTSARGSRRNRRIAPKDDKPEDGGWETISGSDLNQVFNFGKVKLTVKQGDLTKEKVNCIVNSTNTELDLKMGAVSQELARRGGSDLLNEVALKKDEMRKSGIIITTAKGLKADYIVHVSNDFFNQDWKKIISSSLKKANQIQHASSIAFPALGTGQRSTTPEDIAKKMVEVVVDYVKSSGNSSITDIRVVIFQQDMLIPFITGVHEAMQEGKSGKSFFKKAYNWMMSSGNGGKSENPSEIQDREDAISVKLHFFFDQEYSFEMAVKRLNQHYIENMLERKTTNKILKNPNAVLRMKIWSLRNKYAIQVDYDERYGSVNLLGLMVDIVSANDEVHQIIHDAQREEYESEKAEIVSNFVQWSYIDDSPGGSGKIEYDKNCNQIIENAFSDGKPCVKLPPDQFRTEYIIDFNAMVEYPSHDKKDKVVVLRNEKIKGATFEPPATWTLVKSDCELIPVQAASKEYNDVQQKFTATLGRAANIQQFGLLFGHPQASSGNIQKIERVQNKYLWQQYVAKKQQLDSQNPGNQNERELWHGTSHDAVPSIYKHGFNRSYCGKNAVAIGNGVYFAVNSSYSASHTYAVPSASGHKHIFLARVLTGMFTRGQGGLRVPPVRDPAKHIMFDSVADNPASPGMFVIFNDTQAYPEYLITFI